MGMHGGDAEVTDLPAIAKASRKARAVEVYTTLMPRLVAAARDAQSGIRLDDEEPIVREAARVLDQLAVLLFSHGVYRCALVEGCLPIDFFVHPTTSRTEFSNPTQRLGSNESAGGSL